MGLFEKAIELTEEDFSKINTMLPPELRKDNWIVSNFTQGGLYTNYLNLEESITKKAFDINKKWLLKSKTLKSREKNKEKIVASKISLFNTDIYNAKPLGMVDIGRVKKFGTASTGNRFENGFIGYAIEEAIDKTWSENNTQYASVQEAKLELLLEALKIHKDCNSIFKFEIDFRELGSSGNVFIYTRGTACIGDYKNIEALKEEYEEDNRVLKDELNIIDSELEKLNLTLKGLEDNRSFVPTSKSELKKFLNK